MTHSAPIHATLNDWIAHEAIPFAIDAPATLHSAVDTIIAALGDTVELLGFGEALHGAEDMLILRNRLFERLVMAHGYRAIVIESSLPKARLVNDYIAGRGPDTYEAVQEAGFSHGFGRLESSRELIEWMRAYNADPAHPVKLRFYGCDIPTGAIGIASPREVLQFVLAYLSTIDSASGQAHCERIEPLLGQDTDWDNPAIYTDPTQSVGLTPAATALRIATEDLITELRTRQPELIAKSDVAQYSEALQYTTITRQLLNYHAAHAGKAGVGELLGIRDAVIADNLAYIVARERERGKVLVFAHNGHLQRGKVTVWPSWQQALGSDVFGWWPAGAHLAHMLGPRYAVIGSALGVSEANGIVQPEAGTLEARLTATPGPARFIPTHCGQGLPSAEIAALPTRSGNTTNLSYIALSAQSFTDFDYLAVLNESAYQRGGPPLQRAE